MQTTPPVAKDITPGPPTLRMLFGYARHEITCLIGRILNGLGIPGFVRDCDHDDELWPSRVRVRRSAYFTVITVNGLDVYFNRWSGKIDGTGFSPSASCMAAEAHKSTRPLWRPAAVRNDKTMTETKGDNE